METQVKAVVQGVKENIHNRKELYAKAVMEDGPNAGEKVTFTLASPVWEEKDRQGEVAIPEPGTFVIVSDFQLKRAGWRAKSARFLRLGENKEAEASVCVGENV